MAASGEATFASANVNVLSGSSAMPVPNASMPKPIHTQLTSGLIVTSSVIVCVPRSNESSTMYRSSGTVLRMAASVRGGSFWCFLKLAFAGYIVSICLPPLKTLT